MGWFPQDLKPPVRQSWVIDAQIEQHLARVRFDLKFEKMGETYIADLSIRATYDKRNQFATFSRESRRGHAKAFANGRRDAAVWLRTIGLKVRRGKEAA